MLKATLIIVSMLSLNSFVPGAAASGNNSGGLTPQQVTTALQKWPYRFEINPSLSNQNAVFAAALDDKEDEESVQAIMALRDARERYPRLVIFGNFTGTAGDPNKLKATFRMYALAKDATSYTLLEKKSTVIIDTANLLDYDPATNKGKLKGTPLFRKDSPFGKQYFKFWRWAGMQEKDIPVFTDSEFLFTIVVWTGYSR